MSWPLDDRLVQHAVGSVLERSERQEDIGQLYATYVDPGIALRLENDNNQIIFGRRGTGKTHVLKILEHEARTAPGVLPVYVDMRTLGSSALWEDASRPAFVRVSNLLKDVLSGLQNALLEFATRPSTAPPGPVLDSLAALQGAISGSISASEKITTEELSAGSRQRGFSAEVDISTTPGLKVRGSTDKSQQHTMKILREGRPLERILFREIGESLQGVLRDAGISRLLLLLDEWSAVPIELQPLLAEFIKRTYFPYPGVTVKVAGVEYRCAFGIPLEQNNTLGFELSADISASLELDDFFIFDRDEQSALAVFSELLYRHVAAQCDLHWLGALDAPGRRLASRAAIEEFTARRHIEPGIYLRERFGIDTPAAFVTAFFDGEATFAELARAGEGVARDFISLFQDACFDAIRRRKARVDLRAVREVAREWYAKEKVKNISPEQRSVLERIVAEVVGRHKSRSFMFETELEQSEMMKSLFDLRLIHLVKRGFVPVGEHDKGRQYNVYTLDYGTYLDALGTERAPSGDFTRRRGEASEPTVVPFHDDRAIKRIILPARLLHQA